MKGILLFTLFSIVCNSCSKGSIIDIVEPNEKVFKLEQTHLSGNEFIIGDLYQHIYSRRIVRVVCNINGKYFKGALVFGVPYNEICTGYAGKKSDFYLCNECENLCD